MNNIGTHQVHMWLVAATILVAVLIGWSAGWLLMLALAGCGAMLAAIFWIGRSSANVTRPVPTDDRRDISRR